MVCAEILRLRSHAPYGKGVARTRTVDACPGALQTHQAADGPLARIRLPGGALSATQLSALAGAAVKFGSGALELTARGNIQLRGLTDTVAVAEAVAAAGLLPSVSHERVRNIVASPLSGRCGGQADVRGLVAGLDRALCADPRLAALPGRFWFGLDDGRGDIGGLATDIGVHLLSADCAALLLAGRDTGVRLDHDAVVPTLVDVAATFLTVRDSAWRVAELERPTALLHGMEATEPGGRTWPPATRPPVGWITQDDGRVTLGAAVPLGVLTARVAEYLVALDAPVVITPWRSVLLGDLGEAAADAAVRVLAPLGLVFDAQSRWLAVSSCVGSPGCAHARADVRADAAAAVDTPADGHRHFVGCERACGSPPVGQVLVATGDGYRQLRP